jgi:hypothetical protein
VFLVLIPETAVKRLPWRRGVCLVALLGYTFLPSLAQTPSVPAGAGDSSSVDQGRLALVAGVALGASVGIYVYQQQAWWDGPRTEFWVVNDWVYSNGLDKLGHMYGSYLLSYVLQYGLEWSNVREDQSVLFGSLAALGLQFTAETLDGFHRIYGFSPGDAIANIAGATLPILQWRFPVMKNFQLKFSYYPSAGYLDDLKGSKQRVFLDDYEGQRYWLAVDPHFFLGKGARRVLPAWLGFAIGMGLTDPTTEMVRNPWTSEYFLTLDYNLSKIETESGFLKALFRALDFLHLPAPGIALKQGTVRFGVFY